MDAGAAVEDSVGTGEVRDVAVVGAGPAGMAAAVAAARSGARVWLLDPGQRPGGQCCPRPPGPGDRHVSGGWEGIRSAFARLEVELARWSRTGRVRLYLGTTVWAVESAGAVVGGQGVGVLAGERSAGAGGVGGAFVLHTRGEDRDRAPLSAVAARTVVLATGAHDRSLPFPGWDLPGVMTPGAVQALVTGSGVLPGRRILVAGTGPFLLSAAATLVRAGGRVVGVVEATGPGSLLVRRFARPRAWPVLPVAAARLARPLGVLARHRVPYLYRHRVLAAHGGTELRTVTVARVDRGWRPLPGTARTLDCDALAVGFGLIARADLAVQLGCALRLDADGGACVRVDGVLCSSVDGVFAAGEVVGIGGARTALLDGYLAGTAAAVGSGAAAPAAGRALRALARRRRRLAGSRALAQALHEGALLRDGWRGTLTDDTIVCRCEEVDAGRIRHAVTAWGANEPRTVKLFTRAGMGWCQGRVCGPAVAVLCPSPVDGAAAEARARSAARRPFVVPVPLGALAALAGPEAPDPAARPEVPDPAAGHGTGCPEEFGPGEGSSG